MTLERIKCGDKLTILVHGGLRINWKTGKTESERIERTGKVVIVNGNGTFALDMGRGRPGFADKGNIVAVNGKRA